MAKQEVIMLNVFFMLFVSAFVIPGLSRGGGGRGHQ
jgi:hypothetical protein